MLMDHQGDSRQVESCIFFAYLGGQEIGKSLCLLNKTERVDAPPQMNPFAKA